MTHGEVRTYWNGCRCDQCRNACARYDRELRAARRKKPLPSDLPHDVSTYKHWGCRCKQCRDAWAADAPNRSEYQRGYDQKRTDTAPADEKERQRAKYAKSQQRTADRAHRNGFEWTGPELELAVRTDLTIEEIALMIGRTKNSVKWMRRLLKEHPRVANLAGLPEVPRVGD